MGVHFADLLIELSSPIKRAEYERDPVAFLGSRGITAVEAEALAAEDGSRLWQHARSVESDDPRQQFNRLSLRVSDLLVEIDPVVEVHIENNHLTAEFPEGTQQIVVGKDGRLYKLESER